MGIFTSLQNNWVRTLLITGAFGFPAAYGQYVSEEALKANVTQAKTNYKDCLKKPTNERGSPNCKAEYEKIQASEKQLAALKKSNRKADKEIRREDEDEKEPGNTYWSYHAAKGLNDGYPVMNQMVQGYLGNKVAVQGAEQYEAATKDGTLGGAYGAAAGQAKNAAGAQNIQQQVHTGVAGAAATLAYANFRQARNARGKAKDAENEAAETKDPAAQERLQALAEHQEQQRIQLLEQGGKSVVTAATAAIAAGVAYKNKVDALRMAGQFENLKNQAKNNVAPNIQMDPLATPPSDNQRDTTPVAPVAQNPDQSGAKGEVPTAPEFPTGFNPNNGNGNLTGAPAPGKFTPGAPDQGIAGGGGGGSLGGGGSVSALGEDPEKDPGKDTLANINGKTAPPPVNAMPSKGGGTGTNDKGIDLSSFLAQFLPKAEDGAKKEEEKTILDYARKPAEADKDDGRSYVHAADENIFRVVSKVYTKKDQQLKLSSSSRKLAMRR